MSTSESESLNVNSLIDRLLSCALSKDKKSLTDLIYEEELFLLCQVVRSIFLSQSALLELEGPINANCGRYPWTVYIDLLRTFNRTGFPSKANYLFLGDYVDRGAKGIEVICLLFCYKVKFPYNFFLLRGNHECPGINKVYGFYDECSRRYSIRLWQVFQDTFNCLPFCALVGGKIICMHGGLSPQLVDLDRIRNVVRPIDPPTSSLFTDLLWSDPEPEIRGWKPSPRGISFLFGENVVNEFCQRMEIDLVARAHQVVQDGFEFFANRRLVTIFSASNYCGDFFKLWSDYVR